MARGVKATILLWVFLLLLPARAPAQSLDPVFRADFSDGCVKAQDWLMSTLLKEAVRADRIKCAKAEDGDGHSALSVTVRPGDAYDLNPGSNPTERAEIQLRQELVRFDATTWYSFLFKVEAPWLSRKNRTVVHQIKQNIDPRYQKGSGGEEVCDPGNPLFKIEIDSDGRTPIFRAKTAGTESCGDSVGQAKFCGDWPVTADRWHRVHVAIRPSQKAGDSRLALWLDGRACPLYHGVLGYPRFGIVKDGRPFIDTQPRFGIYRDALPDMTQTILFDDIAFWSGNPAGNPVWKGIDLSLGD